MNMELSQQTLAFADKLAKATCGIDAIYRKEIGTDDPHEGLVVVHMAHVDVTPIASYADARALMAEYAQEALCLPEADRRLYYTQACKSLESFCAWRMKQLPDMSDQIGLFLHADSAPASDAELNGYFAQLRRMLTDMGYAGDLKAQCNAWEQKNLVPADEVQGTMDDMMKLARERTGEILELPQNDYYRIKTVRAAAFNASSDYENRCVSINIDPILTRPALKHLVCHEVYPGHFIQFSLRRMLWERGEAGADGLLSVVNHSSSCTFEGIADAGIEFIDWVEGADDEVSMLISTIQAALGTAASYRMHVLKQSDEQVADFLRANAPAGGEGWVANRVKFIKDPARAALIWSYLRGDEGVFGVWRRVPAEKRGEFLRYVYGRLHTVQSMQLFS